MRAACGKLTQQLSCRPAWFMYQVQATNAPSSVTARLGGFDVVFFAAGDSNLAQVFLSVEVVAGSWAYTTVQMPLRAISNVERGNSSGLQIKHFFSAS